MWLKFLIFAGLGYLVYKALMGPGPSRPGNRVRGEAPRQIDDVMVQDPQCKVYFPKREGVSANVDGETVYFCSKECMEKYLQSRKQRSGE